MQESLSQGTIGRVMVDRNTAFHFLDKSGLKRNRQIRMIRNIDYPMEYYLAHVSHDVMASPNDTNDSDDEVLARKTQLSVCGESLKEVSADIVAVAKDAAIEQLIPDELQVVNCVFCEFSIFHHAPFFSSCLALFRCNQEFENYLFLRRQQICPMKWKGYSPPAHK